MSPHFKGTLYAFLLLLLLVAVAQCTVDAKADDGQKVWHCSQTTELITMHKKAALCADGKCTWFDWLSTIATQERIIFAYTANEVTALIITQELPPDNKATVTVKDQGLGVATVTCEYEQPNSASMVVPPESSPSG